MHTRGTTLQNFSWLMAERVFRAGVSALVISYVARSLGPVEFGVLNYALLLLGISVPLASLCFDAVVVAELVRSPGEEGRILGSSLFLRLLAGAGASLLLGAAAALLPSPPSPVALGGVVMMLLLQAAEVPELWFQRHLLARWTAVARSVAVAIGALVKLELARRGAGASALVWAQAIENGTYVLTLAISYTGASGGFSSWRIHVATLRRLASAAWPLGAAGLLVAVYLRLDQLLVQHLLPASTTGAYFAATRLIDVATLAVAAVGTSVFPRLAAAHAANAPDFAEHLQAVFDLLSGLGWLLAIALTVAGSWIVNLLFGAAYHEAATVVIIKGWTAILLFSGIARGQFVVLFGATRANLIAVVIGLVVQSTAVVLLIPALGAAGGALGAAGAAVVSGWLTSYWLPTLRPGACTQTRGLLVLLQPQRWGRCLKLLQ